MKLRRFHKRLIQKTIWIDRILWEDIKQEANAVGLKFYAYCDIIFRSRLPIEILKQKSETIEKKGE